MDDLPGEGMHSSPRPASYLPAQLRSQSSFLGVEHFSTQAPQGWSQECLLNHLVSSRVIEKQLTNNMLRLYSI